MGEEAAGGQLDIDFLNLLKKIDIDNYLYVMPLIEEQKITFNQFKCFDRYYLEKLFEIASFTHIRELGREVEFIEKFSLWKSSNNGCVQFSNNETTKNEQNVLNYNLNHVFKNNPIYYELKSFYDKNGCLGSTEQNKLSRAIVEFYVSKNVRLESTNLQNLASQIHQLFPSEAEEIYFEKQKNQRARGKLFYRYQNVIKGSIKPENKSQQYIEKSVSFLGNDEDAYKIKSFLKYNFQNKEQTIERWKQCVELRLNELINCTDANIANIIDSWPAYKQYFGPDLISIDFERLFSNKTSTFFMNWTKLTEVLPIYINLNLKDLKLKTFWTEAKEKWNNLDQNSKDAILIYVIHGVLKPDKHAKDIGRPTIADSQMCTIKIVEEDIRLDLYTGQPPFLLIKKNLYSVNTIHVITDQIIYQSDTVASALALCFKIYQVFNLNYNSKCINFWLFIQKILFEIDFKSDIVGTSFKGISTFFKAQSNN